MTGVFGGASEAEARAEEKEEGAPLLRGRSGAPTTTVRRMRTIARAVVRVCALGIVFPRTSPLKS